MLIISDKNDLNYNNISSLTLNKKSEKTDTPKHKNLKSSESIRESNKNSYFSKYVGEYNKAKINNKKNNILSYSKVNIERKELNSSNNNNLSLFSHKKKKNNSIEKNPNIYNNNSNIFNSTRKKSVRNINNIFIENKINDNLNKKLDSILSNTSNDKSETINYSINDKDKLKNNEEKEIKINNDNNKVNIPKINNLSKKENAYLILSYSKCLRLCERMIFSRSSSKLRESISKKQILEVNKSYLIDKINELEKKIEICDEKAKNKFVASKTAEMTLNFITNNIENEFKLNLFHNLEDENEKKYCLNFIKFLYLLLDENYEKIKEQNLLKDLCQKISNKGFSNIKDYIYFIYIKNLKENKIIENIDKINKIINEVPDLLSFNNIMKWDKFILYSCYLFKEIVNYANDQIDTFNLKKDCLNLIDIINNKLSLYDEKM